MHSGQKFVTGHFLIQDGKILTKDKRYLEKLTLITL